MTRAPHSIGGEGWSPIGLGVVIGAHLLVLAALLAYQPTRKLLAEAAPVFVRLIEPEPPAAPRVEPPKPLPIEPPPPKPTPKPPPPPKKAVTPPPPIVPVPQQIVVPESVPAPARIEAPAPPPEPPKPVEAPPPPAPVVAAPPPPPPPPAPVVPPNFNAAYLSNPPPAYPVVSRRQGEEGKVMVRVFVSGEGLPQKLELHTSSGFARLDDAAMETIRRWKFVPARQGNQTVAAWVIVPIVFTLNQ